jgi:hypothetical protein
MRDGIDLRAVFGRVRVVDAGAAYRIRVTDAGEDLRVRRVWMLADGPGLWQFVTDAEDFTVQFVAAGEDFTIRFVGKGEGVA